MSGEEVAQRVAEKLAGVPFCEGCGWSLAREEHVSVGPSPNGGQCWCLNCFAGVEKPPLYYHHRFTYHYT